jgi:hypothetical protein
MSKPIKVLVEKINSGVRFTLVDRRLSSRNGKGSTALTKAKDLYRGEVMQAMSDMHIATMGYATDFIRGNYTCDSCEGGYIINLEPWGFAFKVDGGWAMGDSGSTPTPGRAQVLGAYQTPLNKIQLDISTVKFEKVYEVEIDER